MMSTAEQTGELYHNRAEPIHPHTEPTDYAARDYTATDIARMLAAEPTEAGVE